MIEVNNISFKYAGQKDLVFDNFSLRLEENNIYGLLGKNGTGKSTLLYLIAGLLRAKKGTVSFDGVETYKRQPETLQRPGQAFFPGLFRFLYRFTHALFLTCYCSDPQYQAHNAGHPRG